MGTSHHASSVMDPRAGSRGSTGSLTPVWPGGMLASEVRDGQSKRAKA
jgi:hypothetical protein